MFPQSIQRYIAITAQYYNGDTTWRKPILLIEHIDEGIALMREFGMSDLAMKAYAIHPILQGDDVWENNIEFLKNYSSFLDIEVVIHAMEYRKAANSYLPKPDLNGHRPSNQDIYITSEVTREMLIADKLQNHWDMNQRHPINKKREAELNMYFWFWFQKLGIKKKTQKQASKILQRYRYGNKGAY